MNPNSSPPLSRKEDDRPSAEIEQRETREGTPCSMQDMRSNWKWYTVFRGWDPGVYGTLYECYKQGIKFDGFYYVHFDTKEEAIAHFDRYNHAATIAREVHNQLTQEEALAKLDEIPHHRYHRECGLKSCTRRKEYLYHDHHLLTRNPVYNIFLHNMLA
ncbi:hypothetical protein Syun_027265 [Stephania yunnanensis]|uniref:Ribonuclease H1 N-terminal domain-containing protein n=1 Tax=Stephania yunnanensis TaxID=152371 RepID=A0AAP0HMN0_9MAGN